MPELLSAIDSHQQVILKAAPGAGKSTYLPLQILQSLTALHPMKNGQSGQGKIIMMEPRRLAARNIAYYLAKQLGEQVGETVGFRIRGESKVSAQTRLEIVTEGVMTRMIQSDPELTGVDLVIFDEFHERSIHADTALAFCLEIQQALRDDLTLLVMSATLDQEALCGLLPQAHYVESQGRGFPIEYHYTPLQANQYIVSRLAQVIPQWMQDEDGSMLVFLPGVGDIKQLHRRLTEESTVLSHNVDVCPLYGQLDNKAQQMAIAPAQPGRRKIVLATNIAETSLTIEGIRMVVDSGLERTAIFDPKTGITRLQQGMIAQSSAEQRAGRAGRLEAGLCIRMYSEEHLKRQPLVPQAEILRSDLTSLQMELLQWGAQQADELSWLDLPPAPHLQQAKQLLTELGLLHSQGQLTSLATQSQTLGVEPRYASMLLQAKKLGASYLQTALAAISMLEEPERHTLDISHDWHRWQQQQHTKVSLLNRRSQHLARLCGTSFDAKQVDSELLGLCLSLAFPDRVAMRRSQSNGQYLLANGHGASMDESNPLSNQEGLVVVDLMRHAQSMSSQIFRAIKIDWSTLIEILPDKIEDKEVVRWDDNKGQMIAEQQQCFGQLVLSRRRLTQIDPKLIQAAISDYIRRKGLSVLPWSERSINLLQRIRNASEWLPDKEWPGVSDDILLAKLEQWLEPFMVGIDTISKIQKIDVYQALNSYLAWPLNQDIDAYLPTHYQLPTGTRKAIRYQEKCEPVLSVRMQEVFGESDSPVIAQGRKKLVLELLSPAQRPLQVTQDLAGFWQGSYKEVQKEMKGRYPKHVWPDDPANHVATTKTKRHFQPK
ncbi:ATP-dependent helicase HrpB [Vibrio rumoiensis 1S-45]|uniref:ATP-dependent helicase HrpB n=2 Tax=Vibrio rumoiensis TaxID=76258 RepID=A0A1E5E1Y2_9VIBR|nr:ATP-dependent helicase HrpB [Vibrio rumoiensis 1S-45]